MNGSQLTHKSYVKSSREKSEKESLQFSDSVDYIEEF